MTPHKRYLEVDVRGSVNSKYLAEEEHVWKHTQMETEFLFIDLQIVSVNVLTRLLLPLFLDERHQSKAVSLLNRA